MALGTAAQQIGLPLRAGLHTGGIELGGRDIGCIAIHAAARVMAQSGSNEVLVSRIVTDLVAGAGLKFTERGSFVLKASVLGMSGVQSDVDKLSAESRNSGDDRAPARIATNVIADGTALVFHLEFSAWKCAVRYYVTATCQGMFSTIISHTS